MNKIHTTYHHIVPRSRERNGNVVEVPERFHVAWHIIFENLYGKECIEFIELVNKMMEMDSEKITSRNLTETREKIRKTTNRIPVS